MEGHMPLQDFCAQSREQGYSLARLALGRRCLHGPIGRTCHGREHHTTMAVKVRHPCPPRSCWEAQLSTTSTARTSDHPHCHGHQDEALRWCCRFVSHTAAGWTGGISLQGKTHSFLGFSPLKEKIFIFPQDMENLDPCSWLPSSKDKDTHSQSTNKGVLPRKRGPIGVRYPVNLYGEPGRSYVRNW